MKTEDLIQARDSLQKVILNAIQKFEKETTLKVTRIDVERNVFSYPSDSALSSVHVEVTL